ncbi:hypothetical protein chiPu_0025078 [Chiloscyllium punctatum]|uniref:Uncharacterized protein n=1 Tax=Chiloscyllium punctatum TaxID=137246 RepID=A0A401TFB1_CHIPU|nr:hypothetical protein [Chiloscyllium punctatum]
MRSTAPGREEAYPWCHQALWDTGGPAALCQAACVLASRQGASKPSELWRFSIVRRRPSLSSSAGGRETSVREEQNN